MPGIVALVMPHAYMLRTCTLSLQARAESAHMKVQLLPKSNKTTRMMTAASTHANLQRIEATARWIAHAVRRAIPWARPCYICTQTRLAPHTQRAVESRGHLHDATIVPLRHTYAEELTVRALPVHSILSTLNTMSTRDLPFHCHRPTRMCTRILGQ